MATPPERPRSPDKNTDVEIPGSDRTNSSSPSHRAWERTDAVKKFSDQAKQTWLKFEEFDMFMNNNRNNLKNYNFQQFLLEKLTKYFDKDKKRVTIIWNEVQGAEDTVGGLTISPLKERISEIEALGKSWETKLKLLKKWQEVQGPLANAKNYEEMHEKI
mgnify:CR=1 FL=1